MRSLRNEPILTDTFQQIGDFTPEINSLYFCGASVVEDRNQHVAAWRHKCSTVRFFDIESESQSGFRVTDPAASYQLRSRDLDKLFSGVSASAKVYVDITGLTHPVWAALLRKALLAQLEVLAVYVEPSKYSRSRAPVEGQIYDLSAAIQGIAPLPGFARLATDHPADFVFVPLLGFEGPRLRFLIEQIQPGYERILPIVGCPGFKPWYVFETYSGNKGPLSDTNAWQSIRYASANCPFSCYYLLSEIAEESPSLGLKIAPIGTKPHALAAVLFALTSAAPIELVYDHPIRKAGRTEGTDRLFVYHISSIARGVSDPSTAPVGYRRT